MGFSYHYYEQFSYREGISIRMQGDLIMDVRKTGNKDEIIDFIASKELERSWGFSNDDPSSPILADYIRYRLGKDKDVIEAQRLIGARQELLQMLDGSVFEIREGITIGEAVKLKGMLRKVEKEIKKIAKKYNIDVRYENFYVRYTGRDIDVIDTDDFNEELLKAVAVRRGDLKDFIEESERKSTLRLGNFTTPHEIKLTGVLVNTSLNRVEVGILSPQEIEIVHPEHGKNTLYIPEPTYARFRLM